ncbi:MAG TPA: VWA domain-containing protein [Burkholderiales bacterium]|nr:VWA domain-containing protein [Burkholderiales bacterium]
MSFTALSPALAWALLAAVALAIVLLHLLRPPPPRVVVPSLLLWARVLSKRKRAPAPWLISLLLALAAGLSMALALTRPELPGAGPQRLMLVVDNSPSMATKTRDGATRLRHAIEGARALLERSGAGSEVTLMDTAGQLRMSGLLDRDSTAAALDRIPVGSWGDVPASLPPPVPGARVHFFTDGVAPIEVPEGTIVHSVFEPADNVALTAFEVRALPQDPTRVEALVQVLNASPGERRARLLIRGGDGFALTQDFVLRARETINATFDVSDFQGGVLGATIVSADDALPVDDLAYAVVPPHGAKRVLLVTSGNPELADALRTLPGVRVNVVAPERYAAATGYDVLVLDRFAPAEPPPVGALLFSPPARRWLPGESAQRPQPRITGWNRDHAVTRGIAWRKLRLERASLDLGTPTAEPLVTAKGSAPGALVVAGASHARWIKVGFALQDTNFRLQPDFPVFVGNALNWLTETVPVLTRALGSIEVALHNAEVRDGGGNSVAVSATAQGVIFEAQRPDVYTVSKGAEQVLVVANLLDPRRALINDTRLEGTSVASAMSHAFAAATGVQPWKLLLLLAAVLLLVEWAVYTRRPGV